MDLAQWRSGNAAVCKTAMHGFDSHLRLQIMPRWWNPSSKTFGSLRGKLKYLPRIVGAQVVELVYTTDLRSVARKGLRVRLPPWAPRRKLQV